MIRPNQILTLNIALGLVPKQAAVTARREGLPKLHQTHIREGGNEFT